MKKRPFAGALLTFLQRMELNGALSNPRVVLEIQRNTDLRENLLGRMLARRTPGVVKARAGRVYRAVETVLSESDEPLRAKEIHRRCEIVLDEPASWSTVKQCLFERSRGASPKVLRVGYGLYSAGGARS